MPGPAHRYRNQWRCAQGASGARALRSVSVAYGLHDCAAPRPKTMGARAGCATHPLANQYGVATDTVALSETARSSPVASTTAGAATRPGHGFMPVGQ